VGVFFSQVLISFVGGDAVRVWLLSRRGFPVGTSAHAVVIDRLSGLVVQLLVVAATVPFILPLVDSPSQRWGITLVALAGIAGTIVLLFGHRLPLGGYSNRLLQWSLSLSRSAAEVFSRGRTSASVLGFSLAAVLINVLMVYTASAGLGAELSFWHAVIFVPSALFLSMLPISFAGWGVREGAMVAAFGLVGIDAPVALAISITFGLVLAVMSLPGSLFWLGGGRSAEMAAAQAGDDLAAKPGL
jgi:uncharacterized membrane protein YbhN (UPF0104 family)